MTDASPTVEWDEDTFEPVLERLRTEGTIDARAVRISRERLARILKAAPEDPDRPGRKILTNARFDGATFEGIARFGGATFRGGARFGGATFEGDARFDGATFEADARFSEATFEGDARFDGATFEADARFEEATFRGDAWFHEAGFSGAAAFLGAAFGGIARFSEATFEGDARFDGATFEGDARFDWATFEGDARFEEATFRGDAWFHEAGFSGAAAFLGAAFGGIAWFEWARFKRGTQFEGARFSGVAEFDEAAPPGQSRQAAVTGVETEAGLPPRRRRPPARSEVTAVGILIVFAGLACLIGLLASPDEEWADPIYAGGLGVSAISVAALLDAARRRRRAIVESLEHARLVERSVDKMVLLYKSENAPQVVTAGELPGLLGTARQAYWQLVETGAYREAESVAPTVNELTRLVRESPPLVAPSRKEGIGRSSVPQGVSAREAAREAREHVRERTRQG